MSLETASWKGATVPILHPGTVKRNYSLTDYLQWQQNAWTAGGNQYPTMATGFMTTQNGQPAEPIGNSFIGYVEGLLYQNGPVAAVEAKRIEVFSQAPMLFQAVKDGRPGDMYDDESLDLLRTPWVGGTTSDLLGRSLSYADFGGNAYVVIIDGELVVLRPDYVDIVLEERMHEGGQVGWRQVGIMYREMASGVGVPFLRGQYAHYAPKIDPLATYRGMSWLTPVVREVMADKSAIDHRLAFQANAATPNLAVSVPQPLTPEQFGEFVEAMDSQHKGSRNAGKTLYTAGGADVTVIGSNMKEMDFTALLGKSETRIANAGGVPPVVVGFSEGLQGSSLNSGNYESAKRAFADTTCRHLWANWCGSMQVLFPPPEPRDRLWYESRDIPFLHEDLKDLSAIEQTQAATISSLITSGFKPESAVAAVRAHDMSLLEHSGMVSVQLAPPGDATGAPADQFATDGTVPPADQTASDQYIDESAMIGDTAARGLVWALDMVSRGWSPDDHPRNDNGSPGGGRFGTLADRVADAVSGAEAAPQDPLKGVSRDHLHAAAKRRGLNPSRYVSITNLKAMLLDDVQAARERTDETAKRAKDSAARAADAAALLEDGPEDSDVTLDDELDDDTLALLTAMDEFEGIQRAYNPSLHLHYPKGHPLAGQFMPMVDRLLEALQQHAKGGKGDPFDGFDREQLRKVAVKRGIKLKRGESRDDISKLLIADLTPASKATTPKVADESRLSANQERQAVRDKALAAGGIAADFAEVAYNSDDNPEILSERLDTLAQKAREDASRGTPLPDGLDKLEQAAATGDAARMRRAVATFARTNGVTMVGKPGARDKFDPTRHEAQGGRPAADATVAVIRPGVSTRHNGEDIQVTKTLVVDVSDETPAPAKKSAAAKTTRMKTAVPTAQHVDAIKAMTSSADVGAYLDSHPMTISQMREVAKGLGPTVTVSSANTKPQLRQRIIYGTTGFREDSEVMLPGGWNPPGRAIAGHMSSKPILENHWGVPGGEIHFHEDGAIGTALRRMGEDRRLEVDGEPLANVMGRLATDGVRGKKSTQEVVDGLMTLRDRMPEDSAARRQLDAAVKTIDTPKRDPIPLPDGTPEPLRVLMDALSRNPLAREKRRGGARESEMDQLADIAQQFADAKLGGFGFIHAVKDLHNQRHESFEGKLELERAVQQAVGDLEAMRKADRKSLMPVPKADGGQESPPAPAATGSELTVHVTKINEIAARAPRHLKAMVQSELERQAELVPAAVRSFQGVRVADEATWGEFASRGMIDTKHYAAYRHNDGQIFLSPRWSTDRAALDRRLRRAYEENDLAWSFPEYEFRGLDTAGGIVRHEFGHHVAQRFPGLADAWTQAQREHLLFPLADELGVARPGDSLRSWFDSDIVQRAVRSKVSNYAAKSFDELLAELWAVNSGRGDKASPIARRIGTIMREAWLGSSKTTSAGTGKQAPAGLPFHAEPSAGARALAEHVASNEPQVVREFGAGRVSRTELVQVGNRQAVRKTFEDTISAPARQQADAENLAARLAEAVGLPGTPAVFQSGDGEVFMDYRDGVHASDSPFLAAQQTGSDQGKQIALLDAIMANTDRHGENWIIGDDGNLVPIDHAYAFEFPDGDLTAPHRRNVTDAFAYHLFTPGDSNGRWRSDVDYSRSELRNLRARVAELRAEFEVLGRPNWYDAVLARIDHIASLARNP